MAAALRAGVIGAGFIGRVHALAARAAGGVVAGLAASTPERSVAVADELGLAAGYRSPEDIVAAGDVDVVHVCTPNALHRQYAEAALRAGKHVICEKPLATNVEDALALQALAERAGVLGAVPFVYRFHPMVREARSRVLGGELGTVRVVHGSYLQDWLLGSTASNWRVDVRSGGPSRAFADIGSHWCDLAEWISGHRVSELAATLATTVERRPGVMRQTFTKADGGKDLQSVNTEDVACLVLRTDRHAVGTFTASQVSAGRKNRLWLELDGDEQSIAFDQEAPERLWLGGVQANTVLLRNPAELAPDVRPYATLPAGHSQGYMDCFVLFVQDVYRSITAGSAVAGLPTFADGVRAARLTDAVLGAATKHTWIEV